MSVAATGSRPALSQRVGLPLAVVLGLLALLQLLAVTDTVAARYLPPPTRIAGELGSLLGSPALWGDIGDTLAGWGAALGIAVLLGTVLGIVLGRFAIAQALVTPVIEFLRPIPSIALIPLVILTIGGGTSGEVFLATYAALWQMLIAALYASGSVDRVALETADAFGLGRWQRLRAVTLPSMLPGLVTGIRIASATALIIVITSEILIGSPGLGRGLNLARSAGELERMYAYIVVIGVVGFVLNTLLRAGERRLLRWHPSVREEVR